MAKLRHIAIAVNDPDKAAKFFEQAFVVSPTDLGAPANSTMTYALYIYQQAFTFLRMGSAAAMSVMLLLASAIVIALFFAINKRLTR